MKIRLFHQQDIEQLAQLFHETVREVNIHDYSIEASITAKPFFQHLGFLVVKEQQVTSRGEMFINYAMEKFL